VNIELLSWFQRTPARTNPYSKVPMFDGADGTETAMLIKKSIRVKRAMEALIPKA
jgi:hypothetical protein